jgi:5-hydroxyisourate hydrolase
VSGRLTTHVLDTAIGFPAEGINIELYSIREEVRKFIKQLTTNSDGRTDETLLSNEEFFLGDFELVFHVGKYLKNKSKKIDDLQGLLYDLVPVKFTIFSHRNYHIPLLLSPFGYSTYLGS